MFKTRSLLVNSNNTFFNKIGSYITYLYSFYPLFCTLVKKDIKGKYKNTTLGFIWHILSPLLQITVYYLAFSIVFGKNIDNYWLYASSGLFTFHFISSSLVTGASAIISSNNIISKISLPKEIILFSKITSNLITLLITYGIIILLMVITGIPITLHILGIFPLICILYMFMLGITCILSIATIYIRDIQPALPIIVNCLMFSLPIFYIPSQLGGSLDILWEYNPFYYCVEFAHNSLYYHAWSGLIEFGALLLTAMLTFTIGLYIFIKKENELVDLL